MHAWCVRVGIWMRVGARVHARACALVHTHFICCLWAQGDLAFILWYSSVNTNSQKQTRVYNQQTWQRSTAPEQSAPAFDPAANVVKLELDPGLQWHCRRNRSVTHLLWKTSKRLSNAGSREHAPSPSAPTKDMTIQELTHVYQHLAAQAALDKQ